MNRFRSVGVWDEEREVACRRMEETSNLAIAEVNGSFSRSQFRGLFFERHNWLTWLWGRGIVQATIRSPSYVM